MHSLFAYQEIVVSKTAFRFISFMAVLALTLGGNFTVMASSASDTLETEHQSQTLNSNTYYVSLTGSDSNPGSITAPFRTFAKAVSILKAGDTLQVMPGTYTETLTISTAGTAAAPVKVTGDGALLNMQGAKQNGITISGTYINVSGFEVMGATDFGILVIGRNITVENNTVHDNVTRNGVGTCGLSSSWGSAVKIKADAEVANIRNNTVYDNCGEGIVVTRGLTATVENNTVYDNFGVNIYIDNSPFVTVRNNLIYCTGTHLRDGNRATGIALGEEFYPGWGAQLHDILVSGNIVKDCRTGIAAFESNVGGTLTNVTMSNNNVPSGEKRSVSLQTLANQNVMVSNNTLFNPVYILQTAGVTLAGNIITNAEPDSIFADVSNTYWARPQIEQLHTSGITGGCNTNPLKYCPDSVVTRAQMAIFLLKGIHGADYTPPAVGGSTGFNDIPTGYWAATWIKQFAKEGITGGCGSGNYCPDHPVTRAQMAVFLLKARYGSTYVPPAVGNNTGFNDVPASHWAAAWVKQLAKDGITGGCGGGNFCPDDPVTRAQMAVFLVNIFGL